MLLLLLCHAAGTGPRQARYRHRAPPPYPIPGGRPRRCPQPCPSPVPSVPRFGPPLVLWQERGASWAQLQRSLLAPLRHLMRSGAQVRPPRMPPPGDGAAASPVPWHLGATIRGSPRCPQGWERAAPMGGTLSPWVSPPRAREQDRKPLGTQN